MTVSSALGPALSETFPAGHAWAGAWAIASIDGLRDAADRGDNLLRFTKAHGTGNDFVVLPDWGDEVELTAPLVRALCDRSRGLGADGVLRIVAGGDDADAFMDYRNADGSLAEMCGNGIRVVAKHVVDHGHVTPDGDGALRIDTRAGTRSAVVTRGPDGLVAAVTVDMGRPLFEPTGIPMDASGDDAIGVELDIGGRSEGGAENGDPASVSVAAVSMGNPHAILVIDDVERAPVASLGPAIETHPRFPEHTNVEFVQIVSTTEVAARVWERGVGETAACGSGACAVFAALRRRGEVGDEVTVAFPGGDLVVRHVRDPVGRSGVGDSVTLTGPAVVVATGEIDAGWLAAAGAEASVPGPTPSEPTPPDVDVVATTDSSPRSGDPRAPAWSTGGPTT